MQQIAAALVELLDNMPSDSDISGGDDDSDIDKSWLPVRDHNVPSSDDNHNDDDDVGPVCDDGDHSEDNELPDLDQSDIPRPSTSAAGPPQKRARLPPKERVLCIKNYLCQKKTIVRFYKHLLYQF